MNYLEAQGITTPGVEIFNVHVYGMDDAFEAMRHPMQSWDRSSYAADRELAHRLCEAGGSEERKFLRGITLTADFVLPRFVWTEVDAYKVGIVSNSTSTMHTIMKRDLVLSDFYYEPEIEWLMRDTLFSLNAIQRAYRKARDTGIKKALFLSLKSMLPEGFMQRRKLTLNYEVLRNWYRQRKNHRLPHWRAICRWIESLPESWLITGEINWN